MVGERSGTVQHGPTRPGVSQVVGSTPIRTDRRSTDNKRYRQKEQYLQLNRPRGLTLGTTFSEGLETEFFVSTRAHGPAPLSPSIYDEEFPWTHRYRWSCRDSPKSWETCTPGEGRLREFCPDLLRYPGTSTESRTDRKETRRCTVGGGAERDP